jgi:hypothetical protein
MPMTLHWSTLALFLILPLLTAGVGIVCLRLASRVTFHFPASPEAPPLEMPAGGTTPIGRRWRGLAALPALNHHRHARTHLAPMLKPLPQTFEYLAPQKWVVHALQMLRPQLDTLVDEAVEKNNGLLWENLPITLKNRMYERVHREIPAVLDDIIEEIGDQSDMMVDLDHFFDTAERHHPHLSLRLLERASRPFLHAGGMRMFVWTLPGTLVTLLLWLLHPVWWILAIGLWLSMLVGVRMRHVHLHASTAAHKDGRHPLGRQVADPVSQLMAEELLTPRHWISTVMEGPSDRQTYLIVKRHVGRLVDLLTIRTFLQVTVGANGYMTLKLALNDTIRSALRQPFDDTRFNRSQSRQVARLLGSRLERWNSARLLALVKPVVRMHTVILISLSGVASLLLALAATLLMTTLN